VLGHYCREEELFPLSEAVFKMTGLPAQRFGLAQRGRIHEGYYADLVLFDARRISDMATYSNPTRPAVGIERVWVNGQLSYTGQGSTGNRSGRFLQRGKAEWIE
jgi:N-acyl-D-amino-acid deacylase